MNVIGEEALDMYETLEWDADGDENVLKKVFEKFVDTSRVKSFFSSSFCLNILKYLVIDVCLK